MAYGTWNGYGLDMDGLWDTGLREHGSKLVCPDTVLETMSWNVFVLRLLRFDRTNSSLAHALNRTLEQICQLRCDLPSTLSNEIK